MTKQYNDKKYTIEETPFAYCKRHWNKYYKNKTYDGVTISNYINKLKCKRLASKMGIRVPKLYYTGNYDRCPKAVLERKDIIIKNLSGAGKSYSEKLNKSENWKNSEVIIEERIKHFCRPHINKIPFDYKVYLFNGKVAYVLVYNRNYQEDPRKPSFMLLDRNGKTHNKRLELYDHRLMKDEKKVIPSLSVWNSLIESAEKIGKTVFKNVFVRLDFYIDEKGVVFGELSPNPCGSFVVRFHEKDQLLNKLTEELLV
ncbi:MAG: ATP-grasp fold amidoligase family protein [Verrucomicrobia bacterium]|nr:ATP-grasp fold amidoligase family protein [Verrucomicrobiota bacterium]